MELITEKSIKIKKRQAACGPTYCGETKCMLGFWGKLKERGNLEDPCTDGRTRLNTHLTRAGCESEDLSDPTRTRDKCQAAVDTVMNLQPL